MAYSLARYIGDGTTSTFAVPFPFISRSHVSVYVDGVPTPFAWLNDGLISIVPSPRIPADVVIERSSSRGLRLVDFADASALTETDLDLAHTQQLYIAQEALDASSNLNVAFVGLSLRMAVGSRILGAFTDPVPTNRPTFQSDFPDGSTVVQAMPNGTGTIARFSALGSSDPNNCSLLSLSQVATEGQIRANKNGSGAFGTMTFWTSNTQRMSIDAAGDVLINSLKTGTHTNIGAETVTGYITIKDAAGNVRKLAVVS